jgi:hypothetical protein
MAHHTTREAWMNLAISTQFQLLSQLDIYFYNNLQKSQELLVNLIQADMNNYLLVH